MPSTESERPLMSEDVQNQRVRQTIHERMMQDIRRLSETIDGELNKQLTKLVTQQPPNQQNEDRKAILQQEQISAFEKEYQELARKFRKNGLSEESIFGIRQKIRQIISNFLRLIKDNPFPQHTDSELYVLSDSLHKKIGAIILTLINHDRLSEESIRQDWGINGLAERHLPWTEHLFLPPDLATILATKETEKLASIADTFSQKTNEELLAIYRSKTGDYQNGHRPQYFSSQTLRWEYGGLILALAQRRLINIEQIYRDWKLENRVGRKDNWTSYLHLPSVLSKVISETKNPPS